MRAGLKKLLILGIFAGVCWLAWEYFFKPEPVNYGLTTSAMTRGDIVSEVTATGELNAINVVEVGTQVSGTVQEIYVDFNSPVKAGQLIALIDPSVLRLTLNESQASLAVSEAAVKSAQAALTDSQRKYNRNKELFSRKLIARSEVDTSGADVEMKKASLQEAKSRVKQAKAAVDRARTNLNYTQIKSPVNGVVIDRQVDAGQTVAASLQAPTLFKVAEDLTQMKIETKVDEADIGAVAEGQSVKFRVDAFPDETFSGKVVQVRIAPNTSESVVTYTVIIHVSNDDLKLKPGMTANVSIETAKSENALRIPVAALRFTPPEDLLATISFDRDILTAKKTLHSGILWPERDGFMMRPVQVVTGITDSKWVELVKESTDRRRPILREGVELVTNAQKGVDTGRNTSGGLFGAPGGGRRRGGGGPR